MPLIITEKTKDFYETHNNIKLINLPSKKSSMKKNLFYSSRKWIGVSWSLMTYSGLINFNRKNKINSSGSVVSLGKLFSWFMLISDVDNKTMCSEILSLRYLLKTKDTKGVGRWLFMTQLVLIRYRSKRKIDQISWIDVTGKVPLRLRWF